MATIGSSQQAYGPDGSFFTVSSDIDLDTGKMHTIVYGQKGDKFLEGTPDYVINALNKALKGTPVQALGDATVDVITGQKQSLTEQYQQQIPPAAKVDNADAKNAPQTTTAAEQTNKFVANNGVIDDAAKPSAANPSGQALPNQATNSSTTGNKKASTSPDKRPFNPLSNYASYTYQISLYMITPDAYNDFVAGGRKSLGKLNTINETSGKGAYLIAQSGGINSQQARAPGFDLDYYIDDLKIEAVISPKGTGMSATTFEMSFNVIEPYGFSFTTNLKKASDALEKYSKTVGITSTTNPSKQFYILGVKFLGFDLEGNLASDNLTLQERFWDILLTEVSYKIDGKMIVYHIKAASLAVQSALGIKRGVVAKGAVVQGTTLREALEGNDQSKGIIGLLTKMNIDEEQDKNVSEKNVYKVEFIGEDAERIANAKIVTKADLDKSKFPMSNVKFAEEVNVKLENNAVPNSNARQITFKNETPVLQAIQQIFMQSDYLQDPLNTVFTDDISTDPKSDEPSEITQDKKITVKWFNVSTKVANPKFDAKRKDFVFEITYVIQSYSTPILMTSFADKLPEYHGPIKRYDYWYTGKNTEVITYEQSMNNNYFNVLLNTPDTTEPTSAYGGDAQVSAVTNRYSSASRLGVLGAGLQAQTQIATQLLDPQAYAEAKLHIFGDPDWLIQPGAMQNPSNYNKFYGEDGYSVNPNAAQVFIEVDFKEAIDYNNEKGVMDLNDKILFWNYPPEVVKKHKIKGISYCVISVLSSFSKGRFVQDLSLNVNTFGYDPANTVTQDQAEAKREVDREAKRKSPQPPPVGLKEAAPLPANSSVAPAPIQSNATIPANNALNEDNLVNTIGGP